MSKKDSHPHTKEHARWQISTVVLIGLFILFSSFALMPPPPTLGGNTQAKGTRRIILDHADRLEYNAELTPGVQRLVGNVQLRNTRGGLCNHPIKIPELRWNGSVCKTQKYRGAS